LIINAGSQALVRYPARRVTHKAPVILVKPRVGADLIDYAVYIQYIARRNPNAMIHAVIPHTPGPVTNVLLLSRFYPILRRWRGVLPRNLVPLIVPVGALVEEWFGFVRFSYWFQYKIVFYNYSRIINTGFFIPCNPLSLGRLPIDCRENRKHQLVCTKEVREFVGRVHNELGGGVPVVLMGCPERVVKAQGVFDLGVFL
jgi:hypothetical protein